MPILIISPFENTIDLAGIYIHIPFCKQACYYCDFHFSTSLQYMEPLIRSLELEIKIQKNYLDGESIDTIYFGGGTPSLMDTLQVETLLVAIKDNYSIESQPEITIEANPDDLDPAKLAMLKKSGFNRISIGIQSFNDDQLLMLHRVHSGRDGLLAVHNARQAGFENISIDLIFAIPAADHVLLLSDLEKAIDLKPQHISAYALTIEPRTVFGNWLKRHKFSEADEAFSEKQFLLCMDALNAAGYEHYEISNYALPGYRSRHNSSYWSHKKYLGIGPGAHSFDGTSRQHNVSNNHLYMKSLRSGAIPFIKEVLTATEQANEYLMMSLRTSSGCDLVKLSHQYGYDLWQSRKTVIERLIEAGYLILEKETILLSRSGKMLADTITADLFWE